MVQIHPFPNGNGRHARIRADTVLVRVYRAKPFDWAAGHNLQRMNDRPEIADFFRFIDVSEPHPFSGIGSLVKFAEGLAKIDVQNRTVFLFDNDAEGQSAFRKVQDLSLPINMRTMVLPHLKEFESFPTVGPGGSA
jgi:hypothetical protein